MEDDDGVTIEDEGTDERIASGDDERKESSIHLWISCVLLVIVVVVSLIRLIVKRRTPSLVVVDPQERFEALERVRQRQQQLYQEQTNITEQKRRERLEQLSDLPRTPFRRSDYTNSSSGPTRSRRRPTPGG